MKLEQEFDQPGGYQRGLDQLITNMCALRDSISKYDAVAPFHSRPSVAEKTQESSVGITVAVKHHGDMIVFHASENYRFHQLLNDACHFFKCTTPDGERFCA